MIPKLHKLIASKKRKQDFRIISIFGILFRVTCLNSNNLSTVNGVGFF